MSHLFVLNRSLNVNEYKFNNLLFKFTDDHMITFVVTFEMLTTFMIDNVSLAPREG